MSAADKTLAAIEAALGAVRAQELLDADVENHDRADQLGNDVLQVGPAGIGPLPEGQQVGAGALQGLDQFAVAHHAPKVVRRLSPVEANLMRRFRPSPDGYSTFWWDDAVEVAHIMATRTGQRRRVHWTPDGWTVSTVRPPLRLVGN